MANFDKNLLNNEDYRSILEERLQTNSFEFVSAEWSPLSEKVVGYMGEHFILSLNYIKEDKSCTDNFFIKTKPRSNKSQLESSEKLNSFYKETHIYTKVFKKFEEIGLKTSFAPKCYYAKGTETLVLEDMRNKGFKIIEQTFSLDLEHCKAALRALAVFQASSLAYEEIKTKELGRVYRIDEEDPKAFGETFYSESRKGIGLKFDEATTECLREVSKLMPKSEEWKKNFLNKINNFDTAEIFGKELPYRKTCGHGDLWTNNMLFKENGQIDCILIDFQVVRHFHPVVDALLLLYLSTTRSFRRRYKDLLLEYHYSQVKSILSSYGFDLELLLPKVDYLKAVSAYEPVTIFQGVGHRSVILLPSEITNKVINPSGNELSDLLFSNLRTKLAVEAFKNDDNYRKFISDDIYDLYEIL